MKANTVVITEIVPKSVAVISAAISSVIGVFAGVFVFISYTVFQTPKGPGTVPDTNSTSSATPSGEFPYIMLLVLPVFYGIFGYFIGYLGCLVYNKIAKYTGGVRVKIKE